MDLSLWYEAVAGAIAEQLERSPTLAETLASGDNAVHLAVLVEPFLGFILDRTKSIESRFSSMKIAPFRSVNAGDVLLLKAASGPVVAVSVATEVWCYSSLTNSTRDELQRRFGRDLRADVPGFWEDREEARYATLIRLGEVEPLPIPVDCPKADRRGWVVLRERSEQLSLFA